MTDDQAVPLPPDAIKAVRRAISDPGSITPRRYEVLGDASDYESISEWQTRAVLAAAADVLRAQGAATERERIRQLANEHHATCWVVVSERGAAVLGKTRPFADLLDGTP